MYKTDWKPCPQYSHFCSIYSYHSLLTVLYTLLSSIHEFKNLYYVNNCRLNKEVGSLFRALMFSRRDASVVFRSILSQVLPNSSDISQVLRLPSRLFQHARRIIRNSFVRAYRYFRL